MDDFRSSLECKLNLVGGAWTPAKSGETLDAASPSDGKAFARIQSSTAADVDDAVQAARAAFDCGAWSRTAAADRGRMLARLGRLVSEHAKELADLEALDTGKPVSQAANDIRLAARYFEYYGGAADKLHGEVIPYLDGYQVQAVREPLGVTGHIIPWNYPAQMFGRTLAPALAMGNAIVLKPAEDACMTPIRLAELAAEAGFPDGAVNVVTGLGTIAGAALASHPGINFLSFTGSPETGVLVQQAAAANHIGCTLELGGKSPQIVFEDADLDKALPAIVGAIVQNGGQTCSAGSRALIHVPVFDEVVGALADRFKSLVAAPHDADRDLGALISRKQMERVNAYVEGETKAPIIACGRIAENAPAGGYYVLPRSSRQSTPEAGLPRKRCSARCCAACRSRTKRRRRAWRTQRSTDWWPASGPGTGPGRAEWRRRCDAGRFT